MRCGVSPISRDRNFHDSHAAAYSLGTSVMFRIPIPGNIMDLRMTQPLQPEANWRAPRLRLAQTTPAVLRLHSGRRVRGKLQVISVTGGLLNLPSPVDKGSRVHLMFVTDAGTVLGTAEMLPSVSSTLQPFRFLTIDENHARRIRDVIRSSDNRSRLEQQSIIRDRAW
jgi:hypothetical protein